MGDMMQKFAVDIGEDTALLAARREEWGDMMESKWKEC
jgi:hypothetical protein